MKLSLSQGLIDFLHLSPTPFHATETMASNLEAAGFQALDEKQPWDLVPGGQYYITRNNSSIIALKLGLNALEDSGFRVVGAHTDSPCLKVKPNADLTQHGYWQLGVEVYGGALLSPWLDRDLSLAGRVTFSVHGKLHSKLINFQTPIAVIPSLAIHLNREANRGWELNPQKELPPIVAQLNSGEQADLHAMLSLQIEREHGIEHADILDFELYFYDTQPAAMIGFEEDFIAGARLDNLLSCYAGLHALLESDDSQTSILVCTDHEEVGSSSACGADGPFLEQVIQRLLPNAEQRFIAIQQSLLISADNAHGIHPNYPEKHDANHGPLLNHGPVIKINANQRYATNSHTAGFFRLLCQQEMIPVQSFVTRSDMSCGSTIGPITASKLGINTLDIGVPTFAMHSIRELAGTDDLAHLVKALTAFYNSESCE